jgi:hypothetical protein
MQLEYSFVAAQFLHCFGNGLSSIPSAALHRTIHKKRKMRCPKRKEIKESQPARNALPEIQL